MNNKNRKVLNEIFKQPPPANIAWSDIESLFISLGAVISEGNGSRIRVRLNSYRAVFHRPHPERITGRGTVKSVQNFLDNAGVKP